MGMSQKFRKLAVTDGEAQKLFSIFTTIPSTRFERYFCRIIKYMKISKYLWVFFKEIKERLTLNLLSALNFPVVSFFLPNNLIRIYLLCLCFVACLINPSVLLTLLPSPPYVSCITPSFTLYQPPLTTSSSLQHLYPCGGEVPEKRKPPGQPGTSQMVSKLHLHYLYSPLPRFLWSLLHNDLLFL